MYTFSETTQYFLLCNLLQLHFFLFKIFKFSVWKETKLYVESESSSLFNRSVIVTEKSQKPRISGRQELPTLRLDPAFGYQNGMEIGKTKLVFCKGDERLLEKYAKTNIKRENVEAKVHYSTFFSNST